MMHPTRAVVDLAALRHNIDLFKRHMAPGVALMAVVKASAYGHGALPIAEAALSAGASWCGVATLPEALELRGAGITAPVLVMGYTPAHMASDAIRADVRVNICDISVARAFSVAAAQLQSRCRVHVKVDTGMGRLGARPADAPGHINIIASLPGLEVEGVFTHFSCADSDADYTAAQIDRFDSMLDRIKRPPVVHACNSAATMAFPQAHYSMVRVGAAMYGLSPFAPGCPPAPLFEKLRPVLAWHATIASVRRMPHGSAISYGATHVCEGERIIGVVPVGYGDGFRRAPHAHAEVLVRGRRACMRRKSTKTE